MHEAEMHDECSFITLTYSDEHLPKDGSLDVESCQLFLKRLRKRLAPNRIRFFLCGEYGDRFGRPHYHAIIFGYSFPDKVKLDKPGKFALFSSDELTEAWGQGHCSVGAVSFESASYVASYATKKITTNRAEEAKRLAGRRPEFLLMSRGGRAGKGIGNGWISKFRSDVYPSDQVIVNGHPRRPPRYYDGVLKSVLPGMHEELRNKRVAYAEELDRELERKGEVHPSRNQRRLDVRRRVAEAKFRLKSRSLG